MPWPMSLNTENIQSDNDPLLAFYSSPLHVTWPLLSAVPLLTSVQEAVADF